MELKPGYKQTQAGPIPIDWNLKPLGSLTILMTNGFVGTATTAYVDSEDGVLYVQGYNVEENGLNLHGIKRVSKSFHAKNQKSSLRTGDLLTIQTGDIGVTTVVPASLAGANCHALVISRFDIRASDPRYYCQYFNSNRGRAAFRDIETGSTMKHLNVGDLVRLLVPSPPVAEQRAIATALSDVDALLAKLDQLIAKKRDLKQAAMEQLLTGRTRLPGFRGKWETFSFSELADKSIRWSLVGGPFGSNLKASDYVEQGVRIIQLQNIGDGKFHDAYQIFTTDAKADELLSNNIYAGEIILSKMGDPVARACLVPSVDRRYLMASDGIRLAVDAKRFNNAYVLAYINSPCFRKSAAEAATGTTRQRIGIGELKTLPFVAPTLDEQTAIATVLSDMDAEISALVTCPRWRNQSVVSKVRVARLMDVRGGRCRRAVLSREFRRRHAAE